MSPSGFNVRSANIPSITHIALIELTVAKLHFFYSVMAAGKTTHLLQARHNYIQNGFNVVALTSSIDDRFGTGKITSRIGLEVEVPAVKPTDSIFDFIDDSTEILIIDEIQFFTPNHIEELVRLVDERGIVVMCYGLKVNAYGRLFNETICNLLAKADQIKEIKQICWCGAKATMILKHDDNGNVIKSGDIIDVGGESKYTSVCRKHWYEGKYKNNVTAAKND